MVHILRIHVIACVLMIITASCGLRVISPDGLEVAGSLRVNSYRGVRDDERAIEGQRPGPGTYPNSGGASAREALRRQNGNRVDRVRVPPVILLDRTDLCRDMGAFEQQEKKLCSTK